MNELIKVNIDTQTVSARDLHDALGVASRFSRWFETNKEMFVEGEDYNKCTLSTVVNNGAVRDLEDYTLSVLMAKHLAMMSRTEKGMQVRNYLIDLERAWNTPEQVMARALKLADQTIHNLSNQIAELTPKANYFDALVDRNLLTNLRDTAKEIGIKERKFTRWLEEKGYLYRDSHNNLKPFATYITGDKKYFEIKEWSNDRTAGIQTLVTPRGREAFRLLING